MVHSVAIYARVSTDEQSCDRQIAELTDYAARAGFAVVCTGAETGTGAKNDPLERNEVIELARKKLTDLVLVSDLSHWARSPRDLRVTIEDLAPAGVALCALNSAYLDISKSQSKLLLNVLAAISEFERNLLSERFNFGTGQSRSKGTKSSRAIGRPSFDRFERVISLISEGKSVRAVAAELGISKATDVKVKRVTSNYGSLEEMDRDKE